MKKKKLSVVVTKFAGLEPIEWGIMERPSEGHTYNVEGFVTGRIIKKFKKKPVVTVGW